MNQRVIFVICGHSVKTDCGLIDEEIYRFRSFFRSTIITIICRNGQSSNNITLKTPLLIYI